VTISTHGWLLARPMISSNASAAVTSADSEWSSRSAGDPGQTDPRWRVEHGLLDGAGRGASSQFAPQSPRAFDDSSWPNQTRPAPSTDGGSAALTCRPSSVA